MSYEELYTLITNNIHVKNLAIILDAIDECIEGIMKLMESDFQGPVNIGSEEMINMNDFMVNISCSWINIFLTSS